MLFDSGLVVTFGSNSHGQLGRGSPSVKEAPGPMIGVDGPVSRIAAGSNFTACLSAASNTVDCFGQGFPDGHFRWVVERGRAVVRMSASGPQVPFSFSFPKITFLPPTAFAVISTARASPVT